MKYILNTTSILALIGCMYIAVSVILFLTHVNNPEYIQHITNTRNTQLTFHKSNFFGAAHICSKKIHTLLSFHNITYNKKIILSTTTNDKIYDNLTHITTTGSYISNNKKFMWYCNFNTNSNSITFIDYDSN